MMGRFLNGRFLLAIQFPQRLDIKVIITGESLPDDLDLSTISEEILAFDRTISVAGWGMGREVKK